MKTKTPYTTPLSGQALRFTLGLATDFTGVALEPIAAWAQDAREFQTLIFSNSGRGDPVNINCPGSYKPNANRTNTRITLTWILGSSTGSIG